MRKALILSVLILCGIAWIQPVNRTQAQGNTLWLAQYFNNTNFEAPAEVTAYESDVDFNWGLGAPAPGINADNFSARWTTTTFFRSGVYRFTANADDEVRVYVDNTKLVIDTFGKVQPGVPVTVDVTLAQGFHNIQVDYKEFGGAAFVSLDWEFVEEQTISEIVTGTWIAEYYNNRDLAGSPTAIFSEATPSRDWGDGAPIPSLDANNFSARWTSTLQLEGTYLVEVRADDGVRVYVNNSLLIDEWHTARATTYSGVFDVPAGNHSITVEYYEAGGLAFLDFNLTEAQGESGLWTAEFYPNPDLIGAPTVTAIASDPSNNWGLARPYGSMPEDNFSARWTSDQRLEAGTYRLSIRSDDGVRAYVNDRIVIDEWHEARDETYTADFSLITDRHRIVIEYFERGGAAFIEYELTRIGDFVAIPERITTANGTITTSRLNIRNQPSATGNSEVITQVLSGETYPVIGRNADSSWLELQLDERTTGWAFARFVSVDNPGVVPVTSQQQREEVIPTAFQLSAVSSLNIRSQASTRSAILGRLPRNTAANIVARNERSTWWFIEYNGLAGWVSANFVRLPANLDLSQIPVR